MLHWLVRLMVLNEWFMHCAINITYYSVYFCYFKNLTHFYNAQCTKGFIWTIRISSRKKIIKN